VGSISRIAQRLSQSVHRRADAVLEFDDRIVGPQPLAQLLAGYNLAWSLKQYKENSKRLLRQADSPPSILSQFASAEVELEALEAD
jgi:hypothetical protein